MPQQPRLRISRSPYTSWLAKNWKLLCVPVTLLAFLHTAGIALQRGTPLRFHIFPELTQIPMAGTSDSLNLAVSTSVILCEIFHQRQQRQELLPELPSANT